MTPRTFFSLALVALFLGGCATYQEPPVVQTAPAPLSLAQIKEMSAKGVSDETLLGALRASRAVYLLGSDDVKDLQDARVSKAVIDYLLTTPQNYRGSRPRHGYYSYPPPPYWWGWGWHHDFGFHDFHHGFHGHH